MKQEITKNTCLQRYRFPNGTARPIFSLKCPCFKELSRSAKKFELLTKGYR